MHHLSHYFRTSSILIQITAKVLDAPQGACESFAPPPLPFTLEAAVPLPARTTAERNFATNAHGDHPTHSRERAAPRRSPCR
jgi:hypothetical protein